MLVLTKPRTGKTHFRAISILPNEEHVDAAVRELFEETALFLTSTILPC
jgi:ADP-ribose pyrophosphatase YjhB (NUDIX family)